MSESGKTDRWNSLLETLGVSPSETKPAESAPEATEPSAATPLVEQPRAISMLRPEKPKPAAKPKPASQPPAKSASYWSRIAGALGLEAPAAPDEPAEPVSIEPAEVAARHETIEPAQAAPSHERQPESGREPREEFGRRGGRRERPAGEMERPRRDERGGRRRDFGQERTFGAEEEPSRRGGHTGEPRERMEAPREIESLEQRDEAESPRLREPGVPRHREVDESGSVLDYEANQEAGSDLRFGEGIERVPAADEERREEGGPRRRRRRRGRGRRGSSEAPSAAGTSRHEEDIEPAGEDADFDFERDDELEADLGGPSQREARQRAGRDSARGEEGDRYPPSGGRSREGAGERGGRTRRHEGRTSRDESRQTGERHSNERRPSPRQPSGYETEPQPRREHVGRPPRSAGPVQPRDEELELDLELDDEHDEEQGGNVPTHKKIPTWDEAVGILIDANMNARGNSDRDRDRGRGRGRGRR